LETPFRLSGRRRLGDKVGDFVAERVNLHDDVDLEALDSLQLDDPVQDRFPILVAREVIVGNEIAFDPLRLIGANQPFDIVGAAEAGLAPLHINDGAEAAVKGASPPGVEAAQHPGITPYVALWQKRERPALQMRQIAHEIVAWRQAPIVGRAQDFIEPALGFAGEKRYADGQGGLEFRGQVGEHRDTAADVKPANRNLDTGGAQRARNVQGARELVGLYANQADQPLVVVALEAADDSPATNHRVGFVQRFDTNLDIGAEHPPLARVKHQSVQTRQRVGGDEAAPPLDNVALVIVVRGLDQLDDKFFACAGCQNCCSSTLSPKPGAVRRGLISYEESHAGRRVAIATNQEFL
jgi:hypothetical protein